MLSFCYEQNSLLQTDVTPWKNPFMGTPARCIPQEGQRGSPVRNRVFGDQPSRADWLLVESAPPAVMTGHACAWATR